MKKPQKINNLLDYRIFLDAEESVALRRRLERDLIERGYDEEDVMYKWVEHVVPSYQEFLLPYRNSVDKVLINNTDEPAVIDEATNSICGQLRENLQLY